MVTRCKKNEQILIKTHYLSISLFYQIIELDKETGHSLSGPISGGIDHNTN